MSDAFEKNDANNNQSPQPAQTPPCEQVLALIPAYVLDAVDADERRLVEENLSRCPETHAALAEHKALAETLLYSAPPRTPPPQLGDRIQAALVHTTSGAAGPRPRGARSFLQRAWRRAAGPLAAVVLFVLLVGTNVYWHQQVSELHQRQDYLTRRVYEQQAVLVLMGAGNSRRVELPPAEGVDPATLAAVVYDPERSGAFLYVDDFPPLPEDHVYQLWLIRGEERISGGLFRVDEDGSGTLYIEAPEPLGTFDAIGVTPEPAGGSSEPTAPPVVRGEL